MGLLHTPFRIRGLISYSLMKRRRARFLSFRSRHLGGRFSDSPWSYAGREAEKRRETVSQLFEKKRNLVPSEQVDYEAGASAAFPSVRLSRRLCYAINGHSLGRMKMQASCELQSVSPRPARKTGRHRAREARRFRSSLQPSPPTRANGQIPAEKGYGVRRDD